MRNRLENKIALITGGAAGFGKGTAAVLKREGAKVYISDINKEGGEKVASELGVSFFEHDVTDPERWQEVIAEIKTADNQLNILVNNAGIGYMWAMLKEQLMKHGILCIKLILIQSFMAVNMLCL